MQNQLLLLRLLQLCCEWQNYATNEVVKNYAKTFLVNLFIVESSSYGALPIPEVSPADTECAEEQDSGF